MQAFLAILRYDSAQLLRSWVTRLWLPLLVAPALFLVVVSANQNELASETLAAYLAAVFVPLSALAVAVLTSGAIAGEAQIIADGILSRSVTRTEFVAAKLVSRLGFSMLVYLLVMVPFSYLIVRYAAEDVSYPGLIAGLFTVALLLTFLGALGMTLSTVMTNVLVSVLVLLVVVLASGLILQFLGLTWMSTTAVLTHLAPTIRGETPVWDTIRVIVVFSGLTVVAVMTTFTVFRARDL
jgi:ABC-type transport system involved in multi-copper enzyme maturation permease subunit